MNNSESLSIAELCDLPMEARCATLLELGQNDLDSALRGISGTIREATRLINAERLAWAVASNVDGSWGADVADSLKRRGGGYVTRWPLDTPWWKVWVILRTPSAKTDSRGTSCLLSELAISVACEQRSDWQIPSSRPIDVDEANRVFDLVYSRDREIVLGFCRRFAARGDTPEVIANEAWSRVFSDYWSVSARRRFLGLSRISTLVCQVARHVAVDLSREDTRLMADNDLNSDGSGTPILESLGTFVDPAAGLMGQQLRLRVQECMGRLPTKQRIVAEMLWFRELGAKRVAQILGVSEPAISQHLKRARENIRDCLSGYGFRMPG